MKIKRLLITKRLCLLSLSLIFTAVFINGAFAQMTEQSINEAISALTTKIAAEPNNDSLYARRSNFYFNLGKLDEALADANKALQFNPKNPTALVTRAGIKSKRNDLNGAIVDYSEVIRLYPNRADRAYFWRGEIYEQKGDFESALADYDKAVEINQEMIKPQLEASARIQAKKQARFNSTMGQLKALTNPYQDFNYEISKIEDELTAALQNGQTTAPVNLTASQKKKSDEEFEKYEKTWAASYSDALNGYLKVYKNLQFELEQRGSMYANIRDSTSQSPDKRKIYLEKTIPLRIFVRETLMRGMAKLQKFNDPRWESMDKATFEKAKTENDRLLENGTRTIIALQKTLLTQKP